jgi:hypothetical protein
MRVNSSLKSAMSILFLVCLGCSSGENTNLEFDEICTNDDECAPELVCRPDHSQSACFHDQEWHCGLCLSPAGVNEICLEDEDCGERLKCSSYVTVLPDHYCMGDIGYHCTPDPLGEGDGYPSWQCDTGLTCQETEEGVWACALAR